MAVGRAFAAFTSPNHQAQSPILCGVLAQTCYDRRQLRGGIPNARGVVEKGAKSIGGIESAGGVIFQRRASARGIVSAVLFVSAEVPMAVLFKPEVGLLREKEPNALSKRSGLDGLARAPSPTAVLNKAAAVPALESVIAKTVAREIQNSIIDLFIVSSLLLAVRLAYYKCYSKMLPLPGG
jgi:hypothetical protein